MLLNAFEILMFLKKLIIRLVSKTLNKKYFTSPFVKLLTYKKTTTYTNTFYLDVFSTFLDKQKVTDLN